MHALALGWPPVRAPERCRTLVAQTGAVWIWPELPLTLRRGTEIVPVAAESIRFFITRLHGPDALDKDVARAVAKAAEHLTFGDKRGAQQILDDLRLSALSHDGAALMCAAAVHLGIEALDLPLRASMRTWHDADIARLLPIFKLHVEAARVLTKGVLPVFDPAKHPRWPAGAPESQGGEFAPAGAADASGASIIPVASRSGRPPKRSRPRARNKPSGPPTSDTPGVRYLEPGEFPDNGSAPASDKTPPKLLGPEDLRPGLGGRNAFTLDEQLPAEAQPPVSLPEVPPEPPPEIPVQPLSVRARNLFIRGAVRWIERALILAVAPELAPYLILLQTAYWVATECWPYIKAYFDPPKTLDKLQKDARSPRPGYQKHHIVEQTPARKDNALKPLRDNGTLEELIEGDANLAQIPALKHKEISDWYSTPSPDFKIDGRIVSPRDYLRDKSWQERYDLGIQKLKDFGVLKP